MEGEASRVSRRRLLKRLGLGTAVVSLSPIVTSLGSEALAGLCECVAPCELANCSPQPQCGVCGPFGAAYCSQDVDGNCFCWENAICDEVSDCVTNADCPPGYACIPTTCCVVSKCLAGCGIGPRSRRRHGMTAIGRR